jgi:uncharacterized membrane protein
VNSFWEEDLRTVGPLFYFQSGVKMKLLLTASLSLLTSVSYADIIKCTFTEPFIDSTYSMTQSKLTYKDVDGKTTVIKNVSFQIKSASEFVLLSKDGKVLQELSLDHKGSNGMSDVVYPYSVKDNVGYGGCVSQYLKAKEP